MLGYKSHRGCEGLMKAADQQSQNYYHGCNMEGMIVVIDKSSIVSDDIGIIVVVVTIVTSISAFTGFLLMPPAH